MLDKTTNPEILDDFLTANRNPYTGQLSTMDRNDRLHYDKFIHGIVAALHPADALERQLAFSIAADYWRLNRARNIEDRIFALCHPNPTGEFGSTPIDRQIADSRTSAFLYKQSDFKFLSTWEMRIQRTVNRNKAELRELQTERRRREAEQPPTQPDLPPDRNGFVFSNPPEPESAAESAGESTPSQDPPAESEKFRTATQNRSRPEPAPANGFVFSNAPQSPRDPK